MNMPKRVRVIAGTVTSVALAVTAVFALLGPGKQSFETFVRELAAQEAGDVAVRAVTQQMAPTTAELKSIKNLLRDQAIINRYRLCLDTRLAVAEGAARVARCDREAEYQRMLYGLEDCRIAKVATEEDPNSCPVPIEPPQI